MVAWLVHGVWVLVVRGAAARMLVRADGGTDDGGCVGRGAVDRFGEFGVRAGGRD